MKFLCTSPNVFSGIHRSLSTSRHDRFGYLNATLDYSLTHLSFQLNSISINPSSCNTMNHLIVKNYDDSKVLPCLQAKKLACQFHRCWPKTRDSQGRDEGLCSSQPSRRHKLHVRISSPCPPSPQGSHGDKGQGECCVHGECWS